MKIKLAEALLRRKELMGKVEAIAWAFYAPKYGKALQRAFRENIELKKLAVECVIVAGIRKEWVPVFKEWALDKKDPLHWIGMALKELQMHGRQGFENPIFDGMPEIRQFRRRGPTKEKVNP